MASTADTLQSLAFPESFLQSWHCCLLLVKVNYLGSFKENMSSQMWRWMRRGTTATAEAGQQNWLMPKGMTWRKSWAGNQPFEATNPALAKMETQTRSLMQSCS